jgi:hypothetical protein
LLGDTTGYILEVTTYRVKITDLLNGGAHTVNNPSEVARMEALGYRVWGNKFMTPYEYEYGLMMSRTFGDRIFGPGAIAAPSEQVTSYAVTPGSRVLALLGTDGALPVCNTIDPIFQEIATRLRDGQPLEEITQYVVDKNSVELHDNATLVAAELG